VKVTRQLEKDLAWWVNVPSQSNGRPIFRSVETAYLHVDSSDFGWGAVLNDKQEARGFWGIEDRQQHITFKELKAVRHAISTFLHQLAGRSVRLHEDNQAVVAVLTHLTTRSPAMMTELRKLWWLLDTHSVSIRATYIRSAANVWADRLSRELDSSDWTLNPRIFRHLDKLWGPHTVDRFASMENALLARYNSRWLDPQTEGVDCLHLSDADWRREHNWCNPPWELLDDLVLKLTQSGARATVVSPLWPDKAWHQSLVAMSDECLVYPPAHDLFSPGRLSAHGGGGMPHWSVAIFSVPLRAGRT
jgi:ribonuclease HI